MPITGTPPQPAFDPLSSRVLFLWIGISSAVASVVLGGTLCLVIPEFVFAFMALSGPAAAVYTALLRAAAGGRLVGLHTGMYAVLGMTHLFWCSGLVYLLQIVVPQTGLAGPAIATAVVYGTVIAYDFHRWWPAAAIITPIAVPILVLSAIEPAWGKAMTHAAIFMLHLVVSGCLAVLAAQRLSIDQQNLAKGFCCLSCGYDIRGISDRCPECGNLWKRLGGTVYGTRLRRTWLFSGIALLLAAAAIWAFVPL